MLKSSQPTGCDDAFLLYPFDRLISGNALKDGVCTEPFPIPSATRHFAQWTHSWAKDNIDPLHTGFFSMQTAALIPGFV